MGKKEYSVTLEVDSHHHTSTQTLYYRPVQGDIWSSGAAIAHRTVEGHGCQDPPPPGFPQAGRWM